ncbi:hypothetical protein [Paenibacillus sp. GCM10012306]|uniref:hypothetical protein n=1 Tax=Paenibacillus sp. GCM10012306 TaxID=3317342 RepID=UPI003617F840
MYTFDNQLPKTTTYWKENGIFHVKHTSFRVTIEEAYAIAELLKASVKDQDTKAIMIDNREASGVWTPEVNKVWDDTTVGISDERPKKFVTLTNSVTAAMQINRISRRTGNENMSKAFFSDFNDEVKAFIDAE